MRVKGVTGTSVETVWSVPGLEKKLGGVLYEAAQWRFDSRIISTLAWLSFHLVRN